jgi:hypothetical protein
VRGGTVLRPDAAHVARDRVVHPATELGGDHVLVAVALDGAADQELVRQRTVDLCGVDEVDAQLEGALDRPDTFFLVRGAVEGGHAHAPQPDGGYLQLPEHSAVHARPSLSL